MIHPEWWSRSLADAQEQFSGGDCPFGEVVDSLVADLLTSSEFLSFLLAETATRMAGGRELEEAVYAVTEEVAAQMQGSHRRGLPADDCGSSGGNGSDGTHSAPAK